MSLTEEIATLQEIQNKLRNESYDRESIIHSIHTVIQSLKEVDASQEMISQMIHDMVTGCKDV